MPMRRFGLYVTLIVVAAAASALGWLYFTDRLERDKPSIKLDQDISSIGRKKDIGIIFTDKASGLSRLNVEIIQDDKSHQLITENIAGRGERQKALRLTVNTGDLQLKNGPAVIRMSATDHSLFKNESILALQVKIDTVPPQIFLLNPVNYINQGGTGFITYRTSKPATLTGVYVDDTFFPGYTTLINNRPVSSAFFAVSPAPPATKTKITVFARDDAGNETTVALPFTLKPKKFRSDKVNLSETFLQKIVPEFQAANPHLQDKTPAEVFGYVNTLLRDDNDRKIMKICSKSINKRLWEGAFLRMRNAKPTALFGDRRTYIVDGVDLGSSVHLGIDLASTAGAPIEAANHGIVVFAGSLGIYGNAVIIDHGQGVFSLYGHMSSIDTEIGRQVRKEERIGFSGLTGLAGGDHLHFSILVGGHFVNPVEWWDPHWIRDNILAKW